MAAIDALLALIEAQKAQELRCWHASRRYSSGQGRGLTMPPLDAEIVEPSRPRRSRRAILTGCAPRVRATPSTAPNATGSSPWRRAGTLTSCH